MKNPIITCILLYGLCFCLVFSELCVKSDYAFENHLASKTPYRIVGNHTFGKVEYKGCKPSKIWMMVRHGTRTPNVKLIRQIKTRLVEIRDLILENNSPESEEGYLSNRDLDAFKKWHVQIEEEDEKKLAHEGEEEMVSLAERMQSRFPTLLGKAYSNTSYQFKYTIARRTKQSAKSFVAGLFGRQTVKDIWFPEPPQLDLVLRFYKACKNWKTAVKNKGGKTERAKFIDSPLMEKVVAEVHNRLGLNPSELSTGDIQLIYMICAFETAWKRRSRSPWCSAFSIDSMKTMEYSEDLKYYWTDGYGFEITYKQACPTVRDIFTKLADKCSSPKATIYFTHSGTLLKLFAHFGLFKDETHLRVDNFNELVEDRQWKSGSIGPFAANLAFIKYDCKGVEKILTLHNEHIIRLPFCPEYTDLCDLDEIMERFHNSINECAFESLCGV